MHPEAVAFAGSYGFDVNVLAAYRPTGKGRVERQVDIVRDHVLAGRVFDSIGELDTAFTAWVPIRHAQVHRTHGEVIGVRAARDRAALMSLPQAPYRVVERHLRRVGKDCLISFGGSLYSVPARRVRPGQQVEVRVTRGEIAIHHLTPIGGQNSLLTLHERAAAPGTWVITPAHWDGLPDGHTRATTTAEPADDRPGSAPTSPAADRDALQALLTRTAAAAIPVGRRSLAAYDLAAGLSTPASATGMN